MPHGTPQNVLVHSARALQSITHTLAGTSAATLASHTYGYDKAGRITTWQQAGQGLSPATWRFGHNAGDELIYAEKTADSAPSTLLDSENWALDAAGNWISRTRGTTMETRSHNVMNRLTAIGGSGSTVIEGTVNEFARVTVNGASAQLSKDPVGDGFRYRRTIPVQSGSNTVTVSATDTGGATTTKQWQFTVPAASRSFTYDANGNTLSDGQRSMTWDVKNRLRTVTKGGTTWKWDYDHQDRRVKEYENNTLTKIFIWSGTSVVQERNATGTITRTHHSGGFSDGAVAASGPKYQTFTDHLGHVREIVDASGTIVTRYDYTSYQGPVKVSGTVEATFQTIGRYYHHAGSGLELAHYRAYDPELGRWLNEDPLGEQGGLNLYRYVDNLPAKNSDPLGLQSWGLPPQLAGGDAASREYQRGWNDTLAAIGNGIVEGAAAFADGVIPIADPFADADVYRKCDPTYNFSKGAGAFTRNMWAAYGLARGAAALALGGGFGSLAVGRGALASSPIHIAWGSGGSWVHGFGGIGNQIVTGLYASTFAQQAWFRVTGIPVLSTDKLLSEGHRAMTCVSAAMSGFVRSWWPF